MDGGITFPGGLISRGSNPVVVLGPNGAGKTRMMRQATFEQPFEFINALRNPTVGGILPYVPYQQAKVSFDQERLSLTNNFLNMSGELGSLIAKLGAEQVSIAVDFTKRYRAGTVGADVVAPISTLDRVCALWAELLPGREIELTDNQLYVKGGECPAR